VVRYTLPQPFRDLEHTADAGVEVEGGSAGETLARLVLAQSALLAGGGAVPVEWDERIAVPREALDAAAIAILRDLLYRFSIEKVIAGACEVSALEPGLPAEVTIGFGRYDPEAHAEGLDLKAVTRHAARFEERDGRWRARVIFDV
jgi:SHS2 domain-containing protein